MVGAVLRFLFNLMNHNKVGQRSLEDVIGIIGHMLRALGHEANWRQIVRAKSIVAEQGKDTTDG